MFATFYSFKGGVGRSMAMANVAEILAGWGYRVVVCDWDLEAPGIERYVLDRPDELEEARRATGIVDLIGEYRAAIAAPPLPDDAPAPDAGYSRLGNLWIRRPQSCCLTVPPVTRASGGWVGLLPSGRRHTPEALEKYSNTVRGFDWNDFCQNWGGGAYLQFFREELSGAERFADFVLVDSRTGFTEVGGVCTHFLADAVVLCCAANEQNIDGTRDMARMLSRESLVAERGGRKLAVLPVASRIERNAETEYLVKFEKQFLSEFAKFIPREVAEKMDGPQAFIESSQIPYIPKYSFSETLVARQLPGERHRELYSAYEAIARSLVHWGAAHCAIDDAGMCDQTAQVSRISRSSRTTSIVPKGRYYLVAHPSDEAAARALAGELRGAGLDLFWEDSEYAGGRGLALLSVAREAAGMLLLAPQSADREWLDAALNLTLALQAARPTFRPLLLLQPGGAPPDLLQARRFRCLPLPDAGPNPVAPRIFAELLPEPVLPPEPPDVEILGTLVSPTESHPRFCIGRDEELSRIVEKIEEQLTTASIAEVTVAGSAASGKSALVRGGLIPLFRTGGIGPHPLRWQTAYVRAGSEDPLAGAMGALAAATGCTLRSTSPQEQCVELQAHLVSCLRPVALILDKVEEIPLRHGLDEARTRHYYDTLIRLGSAAKAGFVLVVCIRSRHLCELARLFPDLTRNTVSLDPPTPAVMRVSLEGGAQLFGQRIEPGLVDRIVGDIARVRENSRLPGLVLRKLIENRESDTLTHAAYKAFGGIEEIFLSDASASLAQLDPERQRIAACLLTAVIDPRMRRPRSLPADELIARAARAARTGCAEERQQRAVETLATLAGWHLFHSEGDSVTLATEAVARIPQVAQWIEENRTQLETQEMLDQLARIWSETGRPSAFAKGLDLDVFRALGPQSGIAAELLAAANETAKAEEAARTDAAVAAQKAAEARAVETISRARLLRRGTLAALAFLFVFCVAAIMLVARARLAELHRQQSAEEKAKIEKTLTEAAQQHKQLVQTLDASQKELAISLAAERNAAKILREENAKLGTELAAARKILSQLQEQKPKSDAPAPQATPAPVPKNGSRIYFEAPNTALIDFAQRLKPALAGKGYGVEAPIGSGGGGKESEVKYYFAEDKAAAEQLIDMLQGMGVANLRDTASLVKPAPDARPGHFDIALASGAAPSAVADSDKRAGETGWLFFGNYDAKGGAWKHRNLEGLSGLPEKDALYSSTRNLQLRTAPPKAQGQIPPKKGAAFTPGWRFRVLTVWPRPDDDAVWCEVRTEPPATTKGEAPQSPRAN